MNCRSMFMNVHGLTRSSLNEYEEAIGEGADCDRLAP
jgi:hypothetical protein